MTMGEYIKYLREGGNVYGKKWTQEELGQEFTPPVNRAAVNKWETNRVENIKKMSNGIDRDMAIGSFVADLGKGSIKQALTQ